MTSRRTLTAALALTLSLGAAAPALAAVPAPTTTPPPATLDLTDEEEALLAEFEEAWAESPLVDELYAELGSSRAGLIDGSQYDCAKTGLNLWLDQQKADWTAQESSFLTGFGVTEWAAFEAFVFQPDGPQHFGVNGEYTEELQKTLGTLKGFWDVDTSDVQLGAVHGTAIMDDSRMVPLVYQLLRGQIPLGQVQQVVDIVQRIVDQPRFDHGNHPALSFTAMAYSDGDGPVSGLPDKILIGDGILQGMEAVGLGDVAPRGILAHEFAHHVQYELHLMAGYGGSAEVTRTLELEADALAGYYLSHPRGERLRQQRVDAFVRSFGETGDCNFAGAGHHGTPNQRVAAARWGDALANAKGPKGHIRTAEDVSDRFRVALPEILAPDAR